MKSIAPLAAALALWPAGALAQAGSIASREASVPGGWLAVAAYLILWVLLLGFILAVGRAQRAQRDELAQLERRIEEVARRGGPDTP